MKLSECQAIDLSRITSYNVCYTKLLRIENKYSETQQIKLRKRIHLVFVFISIFIILFFKYAFHDSSLIDKVFKFAGFTYGPLLGLFSFGLFTKWKIKDYNTPIIALSAVFISLFLDSTSQYLLPFNFGFEILIINGLLTFLGLILVRRK